MLAFQSFSTPINPQGRTQQGSRETDYSRSLWDFTQTDSASAALLGFSGEADGEPYQSPDLQISLMEQWHRGRGGWWRGQLTLLCLSYSAVQVQFHTNAIQRGLRSTAMSYSNHQRNCLTFWEMCRLAFWYRVTGGYHICSLNIRLQQGGTASDAWWCLHREIFGAHRKGWSHHPPIFNNKNVDNKGVYWCSLVGRTVAQLMTSGIFDI